MKEKKRLENEEIIFAISLASKYSEDYLRTLSKQELLDLYERVMNRR